MSATVTSKGQITIPADIRTAFHIAPGDQIVFFTRMDGALGARVRKKKAGAAYGLLKAYGEELSNSALRQAVGEAVAEGVKSQIAGAGPKKPKRNAAS